VKQGKSKGTERGEHTEKIRLWCAGFARSGGWELLIDQRRLTLSPSAGIYAFVLEPKLFDHSVSHPPSLDWRWSRQLFDKAYVFTHRLIEPTTSHGACGSPPWRAKLPWTAATLLPSVVAGAGPTHQAHGPTGSTLSWLPLNHLSCYRRISLKSLSCRVST
jgi:hypothetical protein